MKTDTRGQGLKMIDLFCGRGGWTKGFLANGWEVRGYDLNPQPDYPKAAEFIQADVMELTADDLRDADFICCSSPCEEFSVHGMKHFHPNPKFPGLGIKLFNHSREICEGSGKPYIMENVRCAEKFVGRAVNHCGPFYLWGSGVPAIMNRELYAARKKGAMRMLSGNERVKILNSGIDLKEGRNIYQREREKAGRKEATAKAAEIPSIISHYIAAQFSAGLSAEGFSNGEDGLAEGDYRASR